MALRYFTAHSSQDYGPITFAILSGSSNVLGSIAGNYFTGMSCSIDFVNYYDVLAQLSSEMNTLMPGTNTSIRYDFDSSKVILSSSLTTTWQFQSSSMNLLGFNQQYVNSNVITGTLNPAFIWISSYEDRADDSYPFEAKPDFNERVADSGRSYVIGRSATMNMRYWGHQLEPKENLFIEQRDERYTWEEFIRDNRKGPYAFIVIDDTVSTFADYSNRDGTYLLLADRMKFDPEQRLPNYYDYWDLKNIKTRMLSAPNQLSDDQFDALPVTASLLGQQGYLLFHMDASAGSKIVPSGSILKSSQFYDSSQYHNSSNIESSSYMMYSPNTTNIMNGKPYFSFTASNDSISPYVANGSYTGAIPTNGLTFVTTIQLTPNTFSTASNHNIYDIYFTDLTDTYNAYYCSINSNTRQITTYLNGDGGSAYFEASSSVYSITASDKLTLINTVDFSTGLSKFYINGIDQGFVSQSGTGMRLTGNNFEFKLADNPQYGGKNSHSYKISDFLVYGNKLGSTELNNLQSYFRSLYDINYTNIS